MAKMIDISGKNAVKRVAVAEGSIRLSDATVQKIRKGAISFEKGDPLEIAKVAGIMAAKRTSEILPLCHNIPLEEVTLKTEIEDNKVKVIAKVSSHAKTGVEMEALTSVSVALLTVWDVVKKFEKDEKGQYPNTFLSDIRVVKKTKESPAS